MVAKTNHTFFTGVAFAVIACLIWSGNFIVAKGVSTAIPPITLAFYRWLTATICIAPFAYKKFKAEWPLVKEHRNYILITAFAGFTCYNCFLYMGAHYTSAINLALIGTTSSPVFATVLAVLMFNEKIGWFRVIGMTVCLIGIILLLSKGSWERLAQFHFSTGDILTLLGALSFAFYNNLAKRKPQGISNINFLFTGFTAGTIMLIPFFVAENMMVEQVTTWSWNIGAAILYLGIGTSILAYLFWNKSIQILGPSRTVLFGNLIPIFSSIEAVLLLNEQFTAIHAISGLIVLSGLVIANLYYNKT
jgi:drug/metabolite transporter (DMT)-like permease